MNGILIGQSSGGGTIDSEGIFQTQKINAAEDILLNGESIKNLYAKKNHSSSSTEFGVGSGSNYGHVKVIDNLSSFITSGAALSPRQGKILNEKITSLQDIIKILNTYGAKNCYLDYGWNISNLSCVPVNEYDYRLTGNLDSFWFSFREVGDTVDDEPFLEIITAKNRKIDITFNTDDSDSFIFEDGASLIAACSITHGAISHFVVDGQPGRNDLPSMPIQDIVDKYNSDPGDDLQYIVLSYSGDSQNPYNPTIWSKTVNYHYADTSNTGYVNISGTTTQTLQEKITDLENRIVALEASIK